MGEPRRVRGRRHGFGCGSERRITAERWEQEPGHELIFSSEPGGIEGTYWVLGPLRSQWVGQVATVQEAIATVVDRLPPDCGPAFVGTPEELASHEATKPDPQKDKDRTPSG
ncbi:DUF6193 family natural product biosynthesis protein [Streptomyces adustus]|uniref:DUF6193 family natural product biosynthesis protein n=1 Tax=Streptomyces adustus TaxID=1609272 RepID=UPI0035D6C76D